MNVANMLTMARMAMVPLIVLCFYPGFEGSMIVAAVLYVIAALTDMFDGRYARKYGMVTDFGKLMDPMADKLLTCITFVMLQGAGRLHPVLTAVFIARELVISSFRLLAATKGTVIAAGRLGKLKTVFQMVATVFLMLDNPFFCTIGFPMDKVLVWLALIFSVVSCIEYIVSYKTLIGGAK